jgi:hypothetical protein
MEWGQLHHPFRGRLPTLQPSPWQTNALNLQPDWNDNQKAIKHVMKISTLDQILSRVPSFGVKLLARMP